MRHFITWRAAFDKARPAVLAFYFDLTKNGEEISEK